MTFKDGAQVTDDAALRGLLILLVGRASLWYSGIRKNVTTWPDALTALRDSFSKQLPPSEVFLEIYKNPQHENEGTELFICKVRALLVLLPYKLPPEAELDIV